MRLRGVTALLVLRALIAHTDWATGAQLSAAMSYVDGERHGWFGASFVLQVGR